MTYRPFVDLSTFLDDHYTPELAAEVARRQGPLIQGMMDDREVHRQALSMHFARARPELGHPWFETVYQIAFGRQDYGEWEWSYDLIAPGKNRITGRTGQLSRVIQNGQPNLLAEGDVEFWGNWVMWPILVSCSGVKPWFDMAFSAGAGTMLVAKLEDILDKVYGMTAEEAGLVTFDNTTIPVYDHDFGMTDDLANLVVPGPDDDAETRLRGFGA